MKTTKAIISILMVTFFLMLVSTSAEAQRRRGHHSHYKHTPRISHRDHHNRHSRHYRGDRGHRDERHYRHERRDHRDRGDRDDHGDWDSRIRFRHHNKFYRYRSRRFYHRHHGIHFAIRNPFGIRIRILSHRYQRFVIGAHIFFYHMGHFYIRRHHYYERVAPPIGARIDELPEGCLRVRINDCTYYEYDGVYYRPIEEENGEICYEVTRINRDRYDDR